MRVTMTATVENPAAEGGAATTAGTGRVARVTGPVVDVEFSGDQMPLIYNALHTDVTIGDDTRTLTLEVAQHIGDNMVRTISMQPTDGVVRGSEVVDTGSAISEPLDADPATLQVTERWPIHRDAPKFDELESKTEVFETGIKVIDLLAPYV